MQSTLQNIQADATKLIDIGVIDFGEESYLRWGHRVVVWKEELKLEYARWDYVQLGAASGQDED